MTRLLLTLAWTLSLSAPLAAQNRTVASAREAFDQLDFLRAIQLAREATLDEDLSPDDRVSAYEVMGISYGILDSTAQAVQALSDMILLDPDREPEGASLSPRLLDMYAQALDQVLVVRGMLVDSNAFVFGEGRVTLRYEVSRPSLATVRVVGGGLNAVIDSQLVEPGRPRRIDWRANLGDLPIPEGAYRVIVTARDSRSQYRSVMMMRVSHAPVDTVEHLTRLPGFNPLSETEIPPRDWRPLGVAALFTGVGAGAALALGTADGGPRTELMAVSVASLATGLVLSLRKPDPRPVPAAIQYNQLLATLVAERNQAIANQNQETRRRVRLTIFEERP